MKTILSVVGARPNYMKVAPVHRAFEPYSDRVRHAIVHTGQHYSAAMSDAMKAFEALTGCGVIVNTSFNVRGEPIVCTPADAYLCFMRTEIDVLVLGNYLLQKTDQKPLVNDSHWREEFELD